MAVHRFSRRWLLVAAGAAGLVGVGAVELPAAASDLDPAVLRARILTGTPPYVGYGESTGRLGLPSIPQLESVSTLLTTTTRIRAYVAGRDTWRVDELTPAGERDTYRLTRPSGIIEYVWDFGSDQLTRVIGQAPLRLPRAADLLPPDLARRLLSLAPGDPVTALPARRVAGRSAAGLRLVPSDPDTTVGRVDVWADPDTALPLRVEVAARTGPTLLFAELTEVTDGPPDPVDLRPVLPPGAGAVAAQAVDLAGVLRVLGAPPPPDRLGGRARVTFPGSDPEDDGGLPGVGLYGTGLAGFALIPLSRDLAERAVDGALSAGGVAVPVENGRGARIGTPLVSLAARTRGRGGWLLVGTVAPEALDRALLELPSRRRA